MTKSELIYKLSRAFPKLNVRQLEKAVNAIFREMSNALISGDRIELRGFGAFSTREREPRQARNPKTGSKVQLGKRKALYFRAGKELRERVNKK